VESSQRTATTVSSSRLLRAKIGIFRDERDERDHRDWRDKRDRRDQRNA